MHHFYIAKVIPSLGLALPCSFHGKTFTFLRRSCLDGAYNLYTHSHSHMFLSILRNYLFYLYLFHTSIYIEYTLVDSKAKYMQSFKGHPIYFDGACNLDIQTPNHKHLSFLEKYLVHSYLLYVSCYLFISFLLRISIDNYPYST